MAELPTSVFDDEKFKERINDPNLHTGINNTVLDDETNDFKFNIADCEKGHVIQGSANNWIVLGRDRTGDFESGYGGKAHYRAGAIDIVVGRAGGGENVSSKEAHDARNYKGKVINPNFGSDSARIYISQKTDVDYNFGILNKNDDFNSFAQSAIAMKADAIRIISRESLKLITHSDAYLSNGDNTYCNEGIKLITITGEENAPPLQSMVLGDNLKSCLDELATQIIALNGALANFVKDQVKFNTDVANHTHYESFFAQKTTVDPNVCVAHTQVRLSQFLNVEAKLRAHVWNLKNVWKPTYLTQNVKNILSKFHKLN